MDVLPKMAIGVTTGLGIKREYITSSLKTDEEILWVDVLLEEQGE